MNLEKGLNCLSLFDGIRCGRVALERAGIEVDRYYSSEINPYAIKIADKNYPQDTDSKLGDVTKIGVDSLEKLGKIDLLIGGSPCQGFSIANINKSGLEDERSKLFYEYVRILNELKSKNKNVKFLLENVDMDDYSKNEFTRLIGVSPIEICSSHFSAQKRNRLYWTNINVNTSLPNNELVLADILEDNVDKKYELSDILKNRYRVLHHEDSGKMIIGTTAIEGKIGQRDRVYNPKSKFATLTATDYKQPKQVFYNGILRKVTPLECERLQTLPDNYTQGISDTQRYMAIGNGWTIDVIAHIFKGLK